MRDLIDRTAALNTEYIVKNINGIDYVMLSEVQMKLRKQPSAQPEETFEFGKWYDFKRGYVLETTVHSFRILKDVEVSSNE